MKIYTRVTYDMETGEMVAAESHEYAGPVALCDGGPGGGGGTGGLSGDSATAGQGDLGGMGIIGGSEGSVPGALGAGGSLGDSSGSLGGGNVGVTGAGATFGGASTAGQFGGMTPSHSEGSTPGALASGSSGILGTVVTALGVIAGLALGNVPGAVIGGRAGHAIGNALGLGIPTEGGSLADSAASFGGMTGQGQTGGISPDSAGPPDVPETPPDMSLIAPTTPEAAPPEAPPEIGVVPEGPTSLNPETVEAGTTQQLEQMRKALRARMGYWASRKTFGPPGGLDIFTPSLFAVE
jgi:hypothetical protein